MPWALSGHGDVPLEKPVELPRLAEKWETISFAHAKELFESIKNDNIIPGDSLKKSNNPLDSIKPRDPAEYLEELSMIINSHGIEHFKQAINQLNYLDVNKLVSFLQKYEYKDDNWYVIYKHKYPIYLNLKKITHYKWDGDWGQKEPLYESLALGKCSIEPLIHWIINAGNERIKQDPEGHYVRIPVLFVKLNPSKKGIILEVEQDRWYFTTTVLNGKSILHFNDTKHRRTLLSLYNNHTKTFLEYNKMTPYAGKTQETKWSQEYNYTLLSNSEKHSQQRDETYHNFINTIKTTQGLSKKEKKSYEKIIKKAYNDPNYSNEELAQKSQELLVTASDMAHTNNTYSEYQKYKNKDVIIGFTDKEQQYMLSIRSTDLARTLFDVWNEWEKDIEKIYKKIFQKWNISKYNHGWIHPKDLIQKSWRYALISRIDEDISTLKTLKWHPKLQKEEDQQHLDSLIEQLLQMETFIQHSKATYTNHKKIVRDFFNKIDL